MAGGELVNHRGTGTTSSGEISAEIPSCIHGPTLLFERLAKDGTTRKFYACSACRDRKGCRFFQWADGRHGASKKTSENVEIQISPLMRISHAQHVERLSRFLLLPKLQRQMCETCSQILLHGETKLHKMHTLRSGITDDELKEPSHLLRPLDNARKEAQFFFSESTTGFIASTLENLKLQAVLCVGCPRIHEHICKKMKMSSFLLDMDHRFYQFYSPLQFCCYNMFNHHFFDGEAAKSAYQNFLHRNPVNKCAIILDPPFGGLIEPLLATLQRIKIEWMKNVEHNDGWQSEKELPVLWIFPYFMEKKILEAVPNFTMLDYEVHYDNHPLYKAKEAGGRRVSPIRIFTNVSPREIVLPVDEGYRYCEPCKRYVSRGNTHCATCGLCPSKDGRPYVHCGLCRRCVKASYAHCETCGCCQKADHICADAAAGCHTCGSLSHKRRHCPRSGKSRGPASTNKRRKKGKKKVKNANKLRVL